VLTDALGGWFPDALRAGVPFELRYSFDTTTPAVSITANEAEYSWAITAVELLVGTTSYSWSGAQLNSSNILLRDDHPNGSTFEELYYAAASMSTDPFITYQFVLALSSSSTPAPTEAMNGVQLGAVPPDPTAFMGRGFSLSAIYSDSSHTIGLGDLRGEVTSLNAVPLPAAAWLLATGLGCLSAWVRRGRRDGKQPCPG
jgi:hypothetical protein